MATATILQPALSSKPTANCDSYITGLLDEVNQRFDAINALPVGKVVVSSKQFYELRGAVRNKIRWQGEAA